MADTVNKELFLDILTKEEKEALLTKKMEEIRKKNEALRKRHEEIEADKRVAAKNNPNKDVNSYSRENSNSGTPSPRKESKPLPGEEKRTQRPARSAGRGRPPPGGRGKDKDKEKPPQGPPPDPSYNFLSDRRREGMGRETGENSSGDKSPRKQDMRRHPKNFGGKDFNNVKAQMRSSKERQERPKSGPPRTKMDLAMVMTGRERKQYMEWKAERDRVDQERLERQKSNTGEWRRAWDAEKHQQDFEQPPSPQRTEPAKRPAGRIGSGRFDRGEREDRQRGDTPRQKAGVKTEQEAKPVGRGRARGRGRGRGRGASPRQRTFSDESRKVERQKDLLVVKIDNSGKDTDQSVEVEYWDDDLMDVRSNSAASVKSAASSREGHSSQSRPKRHEEHQFDDHESQKHDEGYRRNRPRPHSYSHSENEHDESWEDCPEDADYYVEDDYINVEGDDMYNEPLKLDCKLNPDAPEFTPTSPEFMKTPPGLVKVMDWVAEVNTNLSPTSPPPTMDGVDNAACKKLIFKGGISDSPESKQSSSHGGVTRSGQVSEEELSASHKDDEVDDDDDITAPDAADEFLDASGDLDEESSRAPEEHDSHADKVSTPTHQIYSLMPGKTDDAELSDEPHADEDKSSIKSPDSKTHVKEESSSGKDESKLGTEEQVEDATDSQTEEPKDSDETPPATQREASKEAVQENPRESSSEEAVEQNPEEPSSEEAVEENPREPSTEAVEENPREPSSEEAVEENPKESSSEDAGEVKSTTEVVETSEDKQPDEQMAETSLNPRPAESDMAQSQELGHENAPTEEKSSALENVVKPETPPPANTTAAAEDSHVE